MFLLILTSIFSCGTIGTKEIDPQIKLDIRSLDLTKNVNEYVNQRKEHIGSQSLIYIVSLNDVNLENEINHYYITTLNKISDLYYYPINGYIDGDFGPILIYSSKMESISPKKFSTGFIKGISKYLIDDMTVESITLDKDGLLTYFDRPIILNHPEVWTIQNSKIVERSKKINFVKDGVLKPYDEIDLIDFLKVKEGGEDARKKNR